MAKFMVCYDDPREDPRWMSEGVRGGKTTDGRDPHDCGKGMRQRVVGAVPLDSVTVRAWGGCGGSGM